MATVGDSLDHLSSNDYVDLSRHLEVALLATRRAEGALHTPEQESVARFRAYLTTAVAELQAAQQILVAYLAERGPTP